MNEVKKTLLVLTLILALAAPVMAEVPVPISYQGYLTDAVGDPVVTGPYSITFSIWDASAVGSQEWTSGVQVVQVTDGFFNYLLGSNAAFPAELFATDTSRYLEIQVAGNPAISPRTKIASVAYAHRAETIGPHARIGLSTQDGQLDMYSSGNPLTTATLSGNWAGNNMGGSLQLYDETGWPTISCEPDFDGGGGFITITRDVGAFNGIRLQGNYAGTGEPQVRIDGLSRDIIFDPGNVSDDNAVQFPDDVINSLEIRDEPGIVSDRKNQVSVTTTGMMDICVVTITIPEPGYVVLHATAQAGLSGTTGANYMAYQIDKTAGGIVSGAYYHYVGFVSTPNTSTIYLPVSNQRVYFEAVAGSYTYRFEALDVTNSASKYMWGPVLTATYYPSSYGTVTAIASLGETSGFEEVTAMPAVVNGTADNSSGEAGYKVDLRELELKVAKKKAEVLKAERDLAQAQTETQIQSRVKAAKKQQR